MQEQHESTGTDAPVPAAGPGRGPVPEAIEIDPDRVTDVERVVRDSLRTAGWFLPSQVIGLMPKGRRWRHGAVSLVLDVLVAQGLLEFDGDHGYRWIAGRDGAGGGPAPDTEALRHFIALAKQGAGNPACTLNEIGCALLAERIIQYVPGLDATALRGLTEFIAMAKRSPSTLRAMLD
jgi:hypothetical protein